MKALTKTLLVLVGCISLEPALAQPPKTPSEDPGVVDTIKRVERDWADAMIAADMDKLNQIVADDWIHGYPGKNVTKSKFLGDIKSGKLKLESCEFTSMDVKVLGTIAVVQGTVTETTIKDGQGTTSRVAFMDVFVKRGGKWAVVRSQANKL